MNKRFICLFLFLLFLTLTEHAMANPILRQQAQKNVQVFLKSRGRAVNTADMIYSRSGARSEAQTEKYYVFNLGNNEGFVIASGDDCVPEILGYSDVGSFDMASAPENVKAWLKGYEEQISYKQKLGIRSFSTRTTNYSAILPMVTTKWNQGYPYNLSCPEKNGSKCKTGCVATAMAQLMYFHRAKSTSQITQAISPYPAGSIIDWNNMVENYTGLETDAQRKAVADLMAYCGRAVSMRYDISESVANDYCEGPALRNYFDYNPHMYINSRGNRTIEKWEEVIYKELSFGRPMIMSGKPSSGNVGHVFICDGYDGNGYFHFNWGWGGYTDGYYLLSDAGGWSNNLYGWFAAIPNAAIMKLTTIGMNLTGESAFTIDPSANSVSLPISISTKNNKDRACNFSQAIALYNRGNFVEVIKELDDATISVGEEKTVNVTIDVRTHLEDGAYHIIGYSKQSGERDWEENENSTDCYLTLVVKNGTMTFYVGDVPSTVEVISFTDDEAKRICVTNWDTDGDGELSYEEAAAVTDLGSVFYSSSIESFDEIQFFTGISSVYFGKCKKLASITIPEWITSLGNFAFQECSSLSSIELHPNITSIGAYCFEKCSSLQSIDLPSSLTSIGGYAFSQSGLKRITVPSKVKTIGELCFYSSKNLEEVVLLEGVESVGNYTGCSNLRLINIPSTITNIGGSCFSGCTSLTSLNIPESVTSIGDRAFQYVPCSITVDSNNKNYCDISGVLFTKNRKKLLFYPCGKNGPYSIPAGTEEIESFAFSGASLSAVNIPNTLTKINSYAFEGCNYMEDVSLPQKLTIMMISTFSGCSHLKTINIPASVTKIESWVFKGCGSLEKVTSYMTTPCTLASDAFKDANMEATLYVPRGSKTTYKTTDNWKKFSNIEEFDAPDEPEVVQGDADGDGTVDVNDVTMTVSYILNESPVNFVFAAADVTSDGVIDIADVVGIVNIILYGRIASRVRTISNEVDLNLDNLSVSQNKNHVFSLCLNNQNDYVAAQFDIRLPEEDKLESVSLNERRLGGCQFSYAEIESGVYRILVFSLGATEFKEQHGELLNLEVSEGCKDFIVENIMFMTSQNVIKRFGPFRVNTTDIRGIKKLSVADIYSLDGRLIRKQARSAEGLKKGIYIINNQKAIVR
jgi:hypothetical protein